jgi:hypothetical protein
MHDLPHFMRNIQVLNFIGRRVGILSFKFAATQASNNTAIIDIEIKLCQNYVALNEQLRAIYLKKTALCGSENSTPNLSLLLIYYSSSGKMKHRHSVNCLRYIRSCLHPTHQ